MQCYDCALILIDNHNLCMMNLQTIPLPNIEDFRVADERPQMPQT